MSYIRKSPIEAEVKFLVLRDLTAQTEKDADEIVVREAAELEKAAQLKRNADKATEQKESEA
jgi:hypothetical protein